MNTQPTRRYEGPYLAGKRTVVSFGEEGFPETLLHIPDPPKELYVVGNVDALQEGLAVIGARKATPYGISCAKKFTSCAAQKGIVIISGGALGCDSAAHRAALDAGGITVAILGGGCDELYPARNYKLFQEIIDRGGAVIAEHPWKFPPLRHTFRMRNRLIAGLARATLIVEAGIPSGTFTTADDALAANKEVLVIPGAITSPTSQGTNRLLYQGAIPVIDQETFEDALFSIYGFLKDPSASQEKADETDPLLLALYARPMRIDEMLDHESPNQNTTQQIQALMTHLSELQRIGKITAYPDGTFGPTENAFL